MINKEGRRGFSLLGVLVLLGASSVYATEMDECVACHVDFHHKSKTLHFDPAKACASCHEGVPQPQKHLKPHAIKVDLKAYLGVKLETETPRYDIERMTAGMQYPLYYETSRLGEDPNPMVTIPAGEFVMGTNNRLPDEGPEHKVTLPVFKIDIYEVTNLQYRKFINETRRRSPKHFRNRTFPEGKADHPVTYVSWKDADAYCKWAEKRLPTDEEWEKAARSTDGRYFPWGNEFNANYANSPHRWGNLNLEGDTSPVGSFEKGKSEYGVYDMSGNVWEWTDSWYKAYPGNTHDTENYGEKYKTLKGGSWWDCSFYQCGISAPVYNRSFFLRSTKNSSFGFRCAKDA
ncbi:MAG: formylglycine-generating enzyme family protein [Gammaproteobacteria bacterium]|nr:formylglycine-generating enzyme family protein [Gammaproteobacteria bacterium]